MKMFSLMMALVVGVVVAKNSTTVRLSGVSLQNSILEDTTVDLGLKWKAYKAKFKKTYTGLEEQRRFNAWAENDAFIQRHNAEYAQGIHGHWVGHNEVSDLTTAEFTAKYLGTFADSPFAKQEKNYQDHTARTKAAPSSIDWVAKGAVTPVKNQAQCGSCWAFSSTGSLEGAHFVELGKLVSFSEQELVSCSQSAGNQGCNGGIMDNAFAWIKQNGIVTEASYPYTSGGGNTGTCKSPQPQGTTFLKSHVDIPSEAQIMGGVAQQPVSIAVQANQPAFQMYSGGVVQSGCGSQLDHGVLIVGYGTDSSSGSGIDYWKVKNSWGATWGEQGYLRIIRNKGMCGIGQVSCYPTGITDHKAAPTPPPAPGPAPGPSPSGTTHYEDPNAGPCQSGEEAVRIQGINGSFCSPSCKFLFQPCPKDVPAGTTATPQCNLETPGSSGPSQCSLVCSGGAKCPAKASCKMVQGSIGLCTYDS